MKTFLMVLKDEFERLILAAVFLLFCLSSYWGYSRVVGLLQPPAAPPASRYDSKPVYLEQVAFRFLVPAPEGEVLPAENAFTTRVPREWLRERQREQARQAQLEAQRRQEADRQRQLEEQRRQAAAKVQEATVTGHKTELNPTPKSSPPKPKPPPRVMLYYGGFMRAPNGQLAAFIGHGPEGKLVQRFVEIGQDIDGCRIESVAANELVLRRASGEELRVPLKQSRQVGGGAPAAEAAP